MSGIDTLGFLKLMTERTPRAMNLITLAEWLAWHAAREEGGERLAVVESLLRSALSERAAGPVALLAVCAGGGYDVIGVLADHPRARDATTTIVESDRRARARLRAAVRGENVDGVEVVSASAGTPADIVAACGLFDVLDDEQVVATIRWLPELCTPGATVVWSRRRTPTDGGFRLSTAFRMAGFAEVDFVRNPAFCAGTHRWAGKAAARAAGHLTPATRAG
jgi:hypothetical protein